MPKNLLNRLFSSGDHSFRNVTAALVGWLDPARQAESCAQLATWQAADWAVLQTVIFMHGIGPYLHEKLAPTPLYALLPAALQAWLAEQHALNAARIHKMSTELQAILYAANRAGIAVMPLKGSLLGTLYYPSPAQRPMADLDLLIHPADRAGMDAILRKLAYGELTTHDIYRDHHHYSNQQARKVVSVTGEHPDNPRPVEIHTGLRRGIWDGAGLYDITSELWSTATRQSLLGETAWLPTADHLLLLVATHALLHFLLYEGRILQWLDVAYTLPHVQQLPLTQANWSYPVLCLAGRALPSQLAQVDLAPLAAATHPHIRQWCESAPLDTRCGLMAASMAPEYRRRARMGRLERAWERWQPNPWRMALAFGNTPTPLAYAHYFLALSNGVARRVAGRLGRRLRDKG